MATHYNSWARVRYLSLIFQMTPRFLRGTRLARALIIKKKKKRLARARHTPLSSHDPVLPRVFHPTVHRDCHYISNGQNTPCHHYFTHPASSFQLHPQPFRATINYFSSISLLTHLEILLLWLLLLPKFHPFLGFLPQPLLGTVSESQILLLWYLIRRRGEAETSRFVHHLLLSLG